MDPRTAPIQYDADTWLIMRERFTRPNAFMGYVTGRFTTWLAHLR